MVFRPPSFSRPFERTFGRRSTLSTAHETITAGLTRVLSLSNFRTAQSWLRQIPIGSPCEARFQANSRSIFPPRTASSIDNKAGRAWLSRTLLVEGFSVGRILAEIDIAELLRVRREVLRTLILVNGGLTLAFAAFGYLALKRMLQAAERPDELRRARSRGARRANP